MEISDYQSWGNVSAVRVEEFSPDWLAFMNEDARQVFEAHSDNFAALSGRSAEMWILSDGDTPIFFIGVIPYSMVGASTYIWTIPFNTFTVRHLKGVKRLIDFNANRFYTLVAKVVIGFSRGESFAKFFGFTPSYEENGMTIYVRECK